MAENISTRVSPLRAVLLMPASFAERTVTVAAASGVVLEPTVVETLDALVTACSPPPQILISFGTGVIVPEAVLDPPGLIAVNVHAASPSYPGRDPHHFAVFDGASEYGAALHVMTRQVDAGPILDVEMFDVDRAWAPIELLRRANEAGFTLLRRLFTVWRSTGRQPVPTGTAWGPHRYTRKEFLALGRIDCGMTAEEVHRRLKAVAMPGHRNGYITVHGARFRFEDSES